MKVAKPAPRAKPAEKVAEAGAADKAPVEKKPARNARGANSDRTRQDDRREDRRRKGGGRDNNVVGMGDHMPEFIALSFAERRAS